MEEFPGSVPEKTISHRVRIDQSKLDHLFSFINRPYFYQDVAFLKDIEDKVQNLCEHSFTKERQEDMLYDLKQAAKDIFDWKPHIMRSTNQEDGKQCKQHLDEDSVLVIMD